MFHWAYERKSEFYLQGLQPNRYYTQTLNGCESDPAEAILTITDCKVCRFAPDGFTEPSFEAAIWNQSGNLSFDKRGAIYIE